MCSIFGTTVKDIELLKEIGIKGESRGKDATGVTTLNRRLETIKSDTEASKFNWNKLRKDSKLFQGHTRATTHGDEKYNYNNHPFLSKKKDFSLTHNGIIYNYLEIKREFGLPETHIETDTYVVTQLLDHFKNKNKNNELKIEDVAEACEYLQGSFALSILTKDKLFLLRYSNPLNVIYNGEDLTYASTEKMLKPALDKGLDGIELELEEEKVYEFDLKTMNLVQTQEFFASAQALNTLNSFYGSYDSSTSYRKYGYTEEEIEEYQKEKYNTDEPWENEYYDEDRGMDYDELDNTIYLKEYSELSDANWEILLEEIASEFDLYPEEINKLNTIRDADLKL